GCHRASTVSVRATGHSSEAAIGLYLSGPHAAGTRSLRANLGRRYRRVHRRSARDFPRKRLDLSPTCLPATAHNAGQRSSQPSTRLTPYWRIEGAPMPRSEEPLEFSCVERRPVVAVFADAIRLRINCGLIPVICGIEG